MCVHELRHDHVLANVSKLQVGCVIGPSEHVGWSSALPQHASGHDRHSTGQALMHLCHRHMLTRRGNISAYLVIDCTIVLCLLVTCSIPICLLVVVATVCMALRTGQMTHCLTRAIAQSQNVSWSDVSTKCLGWAIAWSQYVSCSACTFRSCLLLRVGCDDARRLLM